MRWRIAHLLEGLMWALLVTWVGLLTRRVQRVW